MSLYEGMFLLDNRQANRDWEGSLESVKAVIEKHGGEILRCDKWGERRLAYEVEGRRRGTYVLAYFNAEGDAVNRIYHDCELSELILRVLMLQVSRMPSEEELRKQGEAAEGRLGRRSSESRGRRPKARDRDEEDEDSDDGDKGDEADTEKSGETEPDETDAGASDEEEKSVEGEEEPEKAAEPALEPVKSEAAEETPDEPAPGGETETESDEEKS